MLSELAQYAYTHNLTSWPGYKVRTVKGYVNLSAQGELIGIEVREKEARSVYAPDNGTASQGPRFCNPLIEKAKIPLCIVEDEAKDRNIPTKHDFFLTMLDDGSKLEPKFGTVAKALRSEETRCEIISALSQSKLKSGDAIGFIVDNMPLEQSPACPVWWSEFRKQFSDVPSEDLPRCFITGELAPSLATVPKVSGLLRVGGHTAGDAFLCFDKDAFQSYGFKKSANATVSEEGMTAVNAALTELIAKAPIFGGAKLVHWYAGSVPDELDPFGDLMEGNWGLDDDMTTEDEEAAEGAGDTEEVERTALLNASQLLGSIDAGERPSVLSSRYYIMPLSGVNGRMMVRGWYEGSFEDLYTNIGLWFEDLRLIRANGRGWTKPPKLKELCKCLLKPGGDPQKVWERIDSELSNLSVRLLDSIIHGNPLPDEVAARALRCIRSAMLANTEDGQQTRSKWSKLMAYQLLKAWLVRHQRQRGDKIFMGTDIDTSPRTVAYCCGQLMAVYTAIQSKAMPDVNVSIAERYYAAASTTPAFVIGKLAQLSQHHLSKLDNSSSIYYQKMLREIYIQIGSCSIPTTLNQEQQTEFALGYYQQQAAIYPIKPETQDI